MDILRLPSLKALSVNEDGGAYSVTAEPIALAACPHDGGALVGFGRRAQDYADLPIHGKRVTVSVQRRRWRCKECGRVSLDPLPAMDDKRAATERLVDYVRRESLKRTFVSIAADLGVDEKTVRNIFADYVAYLDAKVTFRTPGVLGIDEIHLIRDARCVLTNVEERTLYDILPSRVKEVVYRRLVHMPDRKQVRLVTIDMTRAYKDAAEAAFPGVEVIVDKWHVVRMANQCLESVRKQVKEGLSPAQRRTLMHDRFTLLKRRANLNEQQSIVLDLWINAFPLLGQAYTLKEAFFDLYDQAENREQGAAALAAWVESVPPNLRGVNAYGPLLTAIGNWRIEMAAYWEHRMTNAYTEALNGLIRVTDRMGRGYSFEVIRAKMLYSRGLHHNPKFEVREEGVYYYPDIQNALKVEYVADGSFGADISTLSERLEAEAEPAESTEESE